MKRPRPKYQVFISSTFADLRAERAAVTWAILEARQIPAGMENFTAADDRGWGLIQRSIDISDYYVLILAGRYGTYDDVAKLSWTHREYRFARDKGIPVLPFIREPGAITADKMDTELEQQTRLRGFIAEVKNNHHYREWKQSDDLRHEVVQAVLQQITDDEDAGRARPGWFRGDELPSSVSMDEFARISAEAADLRRQVAEHSSRKAALSFGWSDTDGEELVISREKLILCRPTRKDNPRRKDNFAEIAMGVPVFPPPMMSLGAFGMVDERSMEERLSEHIRKFPLRFVLRNKGSAAAKNVVVNLIIERAKNLTVYTSSIVSKQTPWQLDPQQHVYVDGWTEPDLEKGDPSAEMRQRIRMVAAGGEEALVGTTLYLNEDQLDVRIKYSIRDEDGNAISGSLTGLINIIATREVTYDEAREALK